ncbi:hypothetical protein EV207_1254 [Scopulibacillus darangshiensis]|uniref:Uncharacterized protein n=1 Tax=Scopulibacillus darangshiensis TaxID=442528 RepID=A0A4R2NSJ8_9BACL|nr:hypothetical protein EV207_1254 [Scopulibacillus darangshiensis]
MIKSIVESFSQKITVLEDRIKYYLFEKKIKKENDYYQKKYKRPMNKEEESQYKFFLFKFYSFPLMIIGIVIFYLLFIKG